jgi:ABC-type Fe3+-hydroxamate transport system substrate-binding protein
MLRAVRHGQVYAVDPRIVHRQGPRILEAMRSLCASIAAAQSARQ